MFVVRQAIKGFKKGNVSRDRRRLVTFGLLQFLVEKLGRICSSSYEVKLFRVSFCLAFFGAFKISELVAASKKGGGGLLIQDVVLGERVVRCYIRKSKTDQMGRGKW